MFVGLYNYSWLLLTLQVKVGTVASFVGKIFVLCSTTKKNHEYFAPRKLPAIRCHADIVLTVSAWMLYLSVFLKELSVCGSFSPTKRVISPGRRLWTSKGNSIL